MTTGDGLIQRFKNSTHALNLRSPNHRPPRLPRPAHAGGECGGGELPHAMKTRLARFLITYRIAARSYMITLPGVSASHIWRLWDRPGSTLLDVRECDAHGLPVE